jgi:putative membrane protein
MRHFRTLLSPALIAGALLSGASLQAARAAGTLSATDHAFVAMVSQGGMFEVKAGQLGADQGSTQVVRDQAATEAHDHKLVGDKLASIVAGTDFTMPDALNDSFAKELDQLKALSGPAFDAAYLKDMEQVHAKDGAAFAKEAKLGSDPKLRAFATETHAIVVAHVGELKATATTIR